MKDPDINSIIQTAIEQNSLISVTLSNPLQKNEWGEKLVFRPLIIKNERFYQCTFFKENKAYHQNVPASEATEKLIQTIALFKQTQLYTCEADYHLLQNRKGMSCIKNPPSKLQKTETHNHQKQHIFPDGVPNPYLKGLGLMTAEGKVIASKAHKFRQINRFLELVEQSLDVTPNRKIHIVDLGCGKAYLTFALYHYLREIKKWDVAMTGVDLKADVIDECRKLATSLGYDQLQFFQGNINDFEPKRPVDIVVSLHACNTATDIALAMAVNWKAEFIFAAPCCQNELYSQIKNQDLITVLRRGILKERFAALTTDALRAELLEVMGYDTQIIEFIDLEHSPKNLMIRARFSPSKTRQENALKNYLKLKQLLNINPLLEQLLEKK